MSPRQRGPWHLVALACVAVAIAVAAVLELGPPSSSARTSREIVAAEKGVVQSTVAGSGNVEPGTEEFANFRTSGTLADVFVTVGQHVRQGQLLATLDPTSAQLAVNQAQLSLDAAQDELTAAQDGSSSSAGGSGSSSGGDASTDVASASTEFISDESETETEGAITPPTATAPATTTTSTTPASTAPASTSPSTGPKTRTTPSADRQTRPGRSGSASGSSQSSGGSSRSSSRSSRPSSAETGRAGENPSSSTASQATSVTQHSTTPSPSAIASAQAAVDSAELNLRSAQNSLAETKLYAPASGTVVSLASTNPGDEVSAGGSSSTGSGSSGASSTGSAGAGASSSSAGAAGSLSSSGDSSSSTSSSSGFAEIVDTHQLTMTVAFSESDVTKVKVGQPATVTLDALSGVQLAAHVSSISTLGTDDDGVVSYDATLTLDQRDSSVRPGMSASAAVVTGQAQGVTLPNSALSGSGSLGTVDLLKGGKAVTTPVVVGLKGDSRTQIVSGLRAGQQVVVTTVLPSLTAPATGSSSVGGLAGLRARFGGGGGGFGGGGFGGGGGGGLGGGGVGGGG